MAFHINQETDRVNICKAKPGNCPLKNEDGETAEHFDTKEAALKFKEETNEKVHGSFQKLKKSKPNAKVDAADLEKKQKATETPKAKFNLAMRMLKDDVLTFSKNREKMTQYDKNKTSKQLRDRELENYKILGEKEIYRIVLREKPLSIVNGKAISQQDLMNQYYSIVDEKRQKEYDAEKKDYFDRHEDYVLTGYKKDMADVLVEKGRFYEGGLKPKTAWGDTRGYHDYAAEDHYQTCGIKGFNEFEENVSWSEYDSFNSNDTVGIKATVSCNCGEHYKTPVYYEGTMTDILGDLFKKDLLS